MAKETGRPACLENAKIIPACLENAKIFASEVNCTRLNTEKLKRSCARPNPLTDIIVANFKQSIMTFFNVTLYVT